jgi:hypothetical protein
MSCMFRIAGVKLNVDRLLAAVSLPATMSFRKGELRLKTRPDGKRNKDSGAAFLVSDADFDQFEKQKRDAIAFLKTKKAVIRRIMNWPGVDGGELDFGVEQREVIIQCEYFPAELLKLAGSLGLDIEVSLYPPFEEKNKRKEPTPPRTLRRVPRRK